MMKGGFTYKLALSAVIFPFIAMQIAAQDWPQWRGPNRDGIVSDFSPPDSWPSELDLVWRVPVGPGLSSPVFPNRMSFIAASQAWLGIYCRCFVESGKESSRKAENNL